MTTKDTNVRIDLSKRACSESDILSNRSEDRSSTSSACGDEDCGSLLNRLFEEQRYTDVTFFSSSDIEASVSAHRVVLASKSPFFEDLLFGEQRCLADGMHMQVQINDVPFSVFKNLVKYFYTGAIEFSDDNCVLEIYAAAQSFKIHRLADKCLIYIESIDLTEDNVCSVLQTCIAKNIEELKSRCISFIEENTRQVFKSPDFENCSFTTVREICNLDKLSLDSESELLGAILRWTDLQPGHTKKHLKISLVKCIRFLSLSPREFSDVIQKHTDILNFEEGLNILMHLNHPTQESFKSLPKWCQKNQRLLVASYRDIPRDYSTGSKIQIMLQDSKYFRQFPELTSRIYLECVKGVHDIKSIQFSFEDTKGDGELLAFIEMKVQMFPIGPIFRKNYNVKTSKSTFIFPRSVRIFRGKSVEIEVAAKITSSCKLLQFRWYKNPQKDFKIFISSRPQKGNLYCISGIEYETSASEQDNNLNKSDQNVKKQ